MPLSLSGPFTHWATELHDVLARLGSIESCGHRAHRSRAASGLLDPRVFVKDLLEDLERVAAAAMVVVVGEGRGLVASWLLCCLCQTESARDPLPRSLACDRQ